MLKRNEDEIEIYTDVIEKGNGKKCIIIGIITILIFIILAFAMKMEFANLVTYIFYFFPSYLFFIAGIIYLKRERKTSRIVARINKNFIEIYDKKGNKKIMLEEITKLNKISSNLGTFIVIFYKDKGKEYKYSFAISYANKNLLAMAIQEYKKDIIITDL